MIGPSPSMPTIPSTIASWGFTVAAMSKIEFSMPAMCSRFLGQPFCGGIYRAIACRRHNRRLWGRQILPQQQRVQRTHGDLFAPGRARCRVQATAGNGNPVCRCECELLGRGLDRAASTRRHYERLRKRQLLSECFDQSRGDGDVARQGVRALAGPGHLASRSLPGFASRHDSPVSRKPAAFPLSKARTGPIGPRTRGGRGR